MAKFMMKTLLFGGFTLPRSSLLVTQSMQTHARAFTALVCSTGTKSSTGHHLHYCNYAEAKQHQAAHRLWRDKLASTSPTQSIHTGCCLYSSGNSVEGSNTLITDDLIGAWFNGASPFGSVHIRNVPFDVRIEPLNPMEYPELNKAVVKLYYNNRGGDTSLKGYTLSEMGKLSNATVCREGDRLEVTCDIPQGVKLPLVFVVTVPLKFNVDLEGSGSVSLQGLESDTVSVHLKQGDCHLNNLKTGRVTVHCEDGSITSNKQLLGAINLRCGKNGCITGGRVQGVSVDCRTEGGDIDIKTVYADKSTCHSHTGNIHIRDCHGNMTASTENGNVTLDSLDGKLSVELGSGSADVYITRPDDVVIQSQKGDITLRFSEDGACSLDLDAAAIEQEESLPVNLDEEGKGFLKSATEHTVRACSPQGKVSLKKQDWLSAIKLQLGNASP